MAQKILLILFLGFSSLLISSQAVPTARFLKPTSDLPSPQHLVFQDEITDLMKISGEDSFDRILEGRMNLENNDYPGTGANNHHDPSTPSKP